MTSRPPSIGKYELIRDIGEGNMGNVYLGRDPFTLRDVAVKVARPKPSEDDRVARRRRKLFYIEAKAAGLLRHPNIVATIDAGIEDEKCYIVMEYVAGASTLDRYCKPDTLLPLEQVVSIMLKCAIAFDYAHNKGVIHRDIKPKNLMITQDNEVKICDFGLALITDDVHDTQVMGRLGSPRYMSPEQVDEDTVTNQSDIFSLGVVTYELLTGVSPFSGDSMASIARRITREAHKPVRELKPEVSGVLSHIVDRCLKKHPAGRYQTAMDLAGDLSVIYDDIRVSNREKSGTKRFEKLKNLSFFVEFEDSEVLEVMNSGEWVEFKPGTPIMAEGDPEESFYILVEGDVIVRRSSLDVHVLKPGSTFGEISMFLEDARPASIVSRDHVTTLKVRGAVVERCSLSCQLRFHRAFFRSMATRYTLAMQYIAKTIA